MIKKALEYLVELGAANVTDVTLPDGTVQTYSDKPLCRIAKHIPRADEVIKMSTLTSLVDYIKAHVDDMPGKMVIHVVSPDEVRLFSGLDEQRRREHLVTVKAQVPTFPFERFIDHEAFCIGVQAKFVSGTGTHKEELLRFAGTVENGSVSDYGDDGITQKATVRKGVASKAEGIIPNPVILRPYRTFMEVPQPESEFIFRMKDGGDGVKCALFEADGGAWKNEAMRFVKECLESELADYRDQFVVIS